MAKNSRKESRKELLNEEDAFLKAANDGAKWVDSHKALMIIAFALVVGAILGVWGSIEYLRSRDALASELYRQATLAVNATVLAEDSEEAAEPWGDPPSFESEEAKLKEAKSRFERVVNETSGSPAGVLARFFIADIEEQMGDLEGAEKAFGALAKDLGPTDALFFFAVERQ
ncbi:tetratricopeptide repeat protein, partial [Myxococcota bacterium]|nr:tetratricopeptide repeat protein [Myxococcota bacterium]